MKTKKPLTDTSIKQFTMLGIAVLILACIANLYNSYANVRFIHDPIDYLYYFKYVILLASGFAFGYFFTKKSAKSNRLFTGIVYATLAISLFWLTDMLRAFVPSLFTAPYPTGKILFMGMPLVSIVITLIVAYLLQYKPNRTDTNPIVKVALPIIFGLYEITGLIQGVYFISLDASLHSPSALWDLFSNYLVSPFVVALVAYLVLTNIKKQSDRLLYAGLIGVFYSVFLLSLGEFQLEAYSRVVVISNAIATIMGLLFVALLLIQVRKESARSRV